MKHHVEHKQNVTRDEQLGVVRHTQTTHPSRYFLYRVQF